MCGSNAWGIKAVVRLQPVLPCRKLRLNNARVQQCVVEVEGALELLQASGFELDLGGEATNSGAGAVFAADSIAQYPGPGSGRLQHTDGCVPAASTQAQVQCSQQTVLLSMWVLGLAGCSTQMGCVPAAGDSSASSLEAQGMAEGCLYLPQNAELGPLSAALDLLKQLRQLSHDGAQPSGNPSPPQQQQQRQSSSADGAQGPTGGSQSAGGSAGLLQPGSGGCPPVPALQSQHSSAATLQRPGHDAAGPAGSATGALAPLFADPAACSKQQQDQAEALLSDPAADADALGEALDAPAAGASAAMQQPAAGVVQGFCASLLSLHDLWLLM